MLWLIRLWISLFLPFQKLDCLDNLLLDHFNSALDKVEILFVESGSLGFFVVVNFELVIFLADVEVALGCEKFVLDVALD